MKKARGLISRITPLSLIHTRVPSAAKFLVAVSHAAFLSENKKFGLEVIKLLHFLIRKMFLRGALQKNLHMVKCDYYKSVQGSPGSQSGQQAILQSSKSPPPALKRFLIPDLQ